jgi:CRISPR system Cascade subunit CasB
MSQLLERLRKNKENRGMMAGLRCWLVAGKRHRSWPVLSRLGVAIDDDDAAFIAGLFALHPEETRQGNLGTTARHIESKRDNRQGDEKLTPTERRFQHLLSAEKWEVHDRIVRIVLMAKSQGVPVNYDQLARDVRYWGDRTKQEWAGAFWNAEAAPFSEEEA